MPQLDHDNNHTYHAPSPAQAAAYPRIREKSKELALLIDELCNDSWERSTAHAYLETAVIWANASIARNGLAGDDAP
jgi:hypothetical protein